MNNNIKCSEQTNKIASARSRTHTLGKVRDCDVCDGKRRRNDNCDDDGEIR